MFAVGFALREYGAFHFKYNTTNLNVYIASTCLIYMAPCVVIYLFWVFTTYQTEPTRMLTDIYHSPLLELANFHVLGRILYFVPYCAPLHPGRVLTTFGFLSSLVEIFNAIGVSYLANTSLPEKITKLGDVMMKTGLVLQIVVICLFLLCAGIFHRRCAKAGVTRSRKVSTPMQIMYISTALVLARTIYRTVEYFGFDRFESNDAGPEYSPILRYEWFFYFFEATLMFTNSSMWAAFHPRRYLPLNKRIYLERDGVTETEGPGWNDERSYWMTFLDPFGCMHMHRRSHAQEK